MLRPAVVLLLPALIVALASPVAAGDWLHFGYDSVLSGHNPMEDRLDADNVASLERVWGVGCDDGYFSVISRSPAVRDGVLYTSGAGDRLRAYDARTGLLLWAFGAGNTGWAPQPVVSESGVVFYMEGSIPTELFAVDGSTGSLLWQAPLGFDLGFNDTAQVTVDEANGLVYVVENPFAGGGKLFALDIATGEVEWYISQATHDIGPIGDATLLEDGTLYVVAEVEDGYYTSERVVAINAANQQILHQYEAPTTPEISLVTGISLCNGRLVAVYDDLYDADCTVAVYDAQSRSLLWTEAYANGVTGSIACNEVRDTLYIPTDPYLYAVEAGTGDETWSYLGFGPIYSPSLANGVVYAISDTNMYAIDEDDGQRLMHFPLGYEGYETTQVAIADGMVYFSGNGGTCDLFALGLEGDEPLHFDGFIPAAASNAGSGGTFWGTTVWASHDIVFAGDATLTFYAGNQAQPASADASYQVVVPEGNVVRIDDILSHFPDVEPPAALFYAWEGIDPADGLVTSRTFTNAPDGALGTLGQGIIGIDLDELPPPGTSHIVPLSPDTERYRVNLGVVNAGSSTVDLVLRIHDPQGNVVHQHPFSLSAGSWYQFNRVFDALGIEPVERAYAEVAAVSKTGSSAAARFAIYASLVDNDTGDPTYLAGQWQWADSEKVFIPVAAHNPGLAGTQWVTDVMAIGWGAAGATVADFAFLADGRSNYPNALATASTPIAADEHVFLDDIVLRSFGEPNRKGAVYCEPTTSMNLWSRTYNDSDSGTFGQSLPGLLTSRSGITTFEDGMLIGLEESADYRTNLGLVNTGTTSASVTLRIYSQNGTLIDSHSIDLEPRGTTQVSASGAYGTVRNGRVEVSCFECLVLAYASVVDNHTGDATTMLAKPVGW